MSIGIYQITEIATGLIYIGQSVRIEARWKDHQRTSCGRQLDKYSYEVLMECDADVLDFFERAFISGYDCLAPKGLNKTTGGQGLSGICNKGKKRAPFSDEWKNNMMKGQAKRGKRGPRSEETKKKIADAILGRKRNKETGKLEKLS